MLSPPYMQGRGPPGRELFGFFREGLLGQQSRFFSAFLTAQYTFVWLSRASFPTTEQVGVQLILCGKT